MVYDVKEKNKNAAPAGYKPSAQVQQAQGAVNTQLAQKPVQYQSAWQGKMNDTADKIMNRQPFSYNVNEDALYQQYANQYAQQGKIAMMDTMGQAQAMTGGYGNSYAQMAGQQAYQGYMQQLNDKIPDLYQLALQQYTQQGQDLYDQYAMLSAQEQQDYGRYRDEMSDYNAELQNLYSRLDAERSYDYEQYLNNRNYQYQQQRDQVADSQWQQQYDESLRQWNESFDYQQQRDAVSDQQWKDSFQYQQDRDSVADAQWQKQYEEAIRQWQAEYDEGVRQFDFANKLGEFAVPESTGGGGGVGGSYSQQVSEPQQESSNVDQAREMLDAIVNNAAGTKYETAAKTHVNKEIDAALNAGAITQQEANTLKKEYGTTPKSTVKKATASDRRFTK